MTLVFSAVLVLLVLYVALVMPVAGRLLRSCSREPDPSILSSFTMDKYSPMQGLLDDEDFRFVLQQPGFDSKLLRKLRRDRLRIFRMYLFTMIGEANDLYQLGRLFLAEAAEDHSALFIALLLLRFRFCVAVLRADFSYHLCCLGIGKLSTAKLFGQLNAMQLHLAPTFRAS